MAETDFAAFEGKNRQDRTVMHVLYGLHTLSWASAYMLAVIALVVNYVKRSDEVDSLYVAHHNYMISTFWWTLAWFVITSPLWLFMFILIPVGPVAWFIVGIWYLYRCVKGWMRFTNNRLPS